MTRAQILLFLAFSVLLTLLLADLVSLPALLYFLSAVLLFCLPGVFLGFWLFGVRVRRHPESLVLGAVIGLAVCEYSGLLMGYLRGWSVPFITSTILLLALAAFLVTRRHWKGYLVDKLVPWDGRDYTILLLLSIILVAFVSIPYMNVGRMTPHGHAYAWLFGFDFLLRSTMAAMITAGLPPDYPHLAGQTMHYYLVSYTLPAFAYSASGKNVSLHSMMQLTSLFNSLLFLSCLFVFLRHSIRRRIPLLLTGLVAMLAYSYYDIYVAVKYGLRALGGAGQRIAEGLGLLDFAEVSHLYQRYFLVEPQALMGLSVFLVVWFLLELLQYRVRTLPSALLLGLLIGIEFGIEAWLGLLLVIWFGCVQLLHWIRPGKQVQGSYLPLAVCALVVASVYGSFFAIGLFELNSGQMVSFSPYWKLLVFAPVYLLLEYGPMLVFGLAALFLTKHNQYVGWLTPYSVLAGLTLLMIFFVRSPVLPVMGVLRGHRTLPLVLLVWTGYFFTDYLARSRPRAARMAVAALLIAAIPTFATDIYFSANVSNPRDTTYVNPADMRAAEWIRKHLPENALMQSQPSYRNYTVGVPNRRYALSLLPNFAERRVVLGEEWIAQNIIVNSLPIVASRRNDIQRMFEAHDISEILSVTERYNIEYLYVGPFEQQLYPGFSQLLKAHPRQFQEIYYRDNVHIFRCIRKSQDPTTKSVATAEREPGHDPAREPIP